MNVPLLVVGAGGFAQEVIDLVAALQDDNHARRPLGVVDDAPSEHAKRQLDRLGIPLLGTLDGWIHASRDSSRSEQYVIAIGDPQARYRLDTRLTSRGHEATTLVHPRAILSPRSNLGPGTIVCAGATISANVRTGRHTHINPAATIGHDVRLGNYVSVNPGAVISGNVNVDERVLIGSSATILQGKQVGANSVVGAAALVTRTVPANTVVQGIPARARQPRP